MPRGGARVGMTRRDFFERNFERGATGCWEWIGHIAPHGYGQFRAMTPTPQWAHRVSYEMFVGPIPAGAQIDHLCRNRACVNPSHLEAVTQRENILRSMSPNAIAVRTNKCKRDHEYTPENTYLRPDGHGRQCRECIRIRSARQAARRRAARTDDEMEDA